MDCSPPSFLCPWNSPGKYWNEFSHFLLKDLPDPGIEFHLREAKSIKTGSRMYPELAGSRRGTLLISRHQVSVLQDEKSPDNEDDDESTIY